MVAVHEPDLVVLTVPDEVDDEFFTLLATGLDAPRGECQAGDISSVSATYLPSPSAVPTSDCSPSESDAYSIGLSSASSSGRRPPRTRDGFNRVSGPLGTRQAGRHS
ncbi:hypothetical protein BRD05_08215 [Halobacteriales archaeon QS_9_70_65]|nr:MAG: hypothetical protein BRD05_08215 [Halobacteriales archaeon QS_9_70_65]